MEKEVTPGRGVKVQTCREISLRYIGQPGKQNRNKLLEEKSAKRAVKKSDGKQEAVGWMDRHAFPALLGLVKPRDAGETGTGNQKRLKHLG